MTEVASVLREVMEAMEVLETPRASGNDVAAWLRRWGAEEVQVVQVSGEAGSTDFVKVRIPGGSRGPTLGVIGRLGGVGAVGRVRGPSESARACVRR